MKKISLTINGQEVKASADETILDVVRRTRIDDIPTLCYDPRIEPYGSCFLCVVEVKGIGRLIPSCATKVTEGMVVITDNERIRESRKRALERLLSNHYADCIGPCKANCPAGVDAQGYIALISAGKYREALKLVKEKNPLPLSIGRVCVRDCEAACRRKLVDEPVAINALKRFVADRDSVQMWMPERQADNGRRVAVVGGGPSGLSCAYYLNLRGYKVTIFEGSSKLGGMLRFGIPEYRLPKAILDEEIHWIVNQGIDVQTDQRLGKDYSVEDLLSRGFQAVYLAVGAHEASKMGLEGEDSTDGVLRGIDFLREFATTAPPRLNGRVVVVGGGNTAIDAARSALRSGAEQVQIVYRRSIKEMPAHEEEIEAARNEGIEFMFLTNPKALVRSGERLSGVECLKMELKAGKPGERPRPVPIDHSEFTVACDHLIAAIGQQVDPFGLNGDGGLELERWGTVKVNPATLQTNREGVFAGGDVVTGPYTAISSIAQGRKAAESIERYLGTEDRENGDFRFYSFKHRFREVQPRELAAEKRIAREKMAELPVTERVDNFQEVELGFSPDQVSCETGRCLECGCSEYYDCQLRKYADEYEVDISSMLGETRQYSVDNRHPFIRLDANKCINCGRCVRTCSEILKVSALGFVYRGLKAVVKPAMERALMETNCVSCGNCIDACPTGAISEKYPFKVLGTLPKEDHPSICHFCSLGCSLNFKAVKEDIFYVSNTTEQVMESRNRGYLCSKGRFGYRYLLEGDRLDRPLIRSRGKQIPGDWDEAMKIVGKKLKEIRDRYGSQSVALFASPLLSNEELYLIQKMARVGLKTNHVYSLSHLLSGSADRELDPMWGATVSTMTVEELKHADVIVVVNAGLSEENLVMELALKEAQKRGARIVLLHSSEMKLTKHADLWLDGKRGTHSVLLNGVIRELLAKSDRQNRIEGLPDGELKRLAGMVSSFSPSRVCSLAGISVAKYDEFLRLLVNPQARVAFLTNLDASRERSRGDLEAMANYLRLTGRDGCKGNGLIAFRRYGNSTGLLDMGVHPFYLPGYVQMHEATEISRIGKGWGSEVADVFKPSDLRQAMIAGDIKAALIFGEDPLSETDYWRYFAGLDFLLVSDLTMTATAREGDVVLPAASHLEQTGTYTTCDRLVQRADGFLPPPSGLENWRIIQKLCTLFGMPCSYQSLDEVWQEIKTINRVYRDAEIGFHWGKEGGLPVGVTSPEVTLLIDEPDLAVSGQEPVSLLASEIYFQRRIGRNLMV